MSAAHTKRRKVDINIDDKQKSEAFSDGRLMQEELCRSYMARGEEGSHGEGSTLPS